MAERDGEGVHDPGQGRTLLGDADEHLSWAAVVVLTDGDEALAVRYPELERAGPAAPRQSAADRFGQGRGDILDGGGWLRRRFVAGGQGLSHLAVVPVDGDRLQAEPPRLHVQLLDVIDGDVLGHVAGLGDGPGQERLDGTHHPDVAHVVDGVVAHGGGEHGHVLGPNLRAADHRLVLVDPGQDGSRLLVVVAQPGQCTGNGAVDDRHSAAPDQALVLHQAEVRFDARGVAVHEQADGARGGQDRGLAVSHPNALSKGTGLEPRRPASVHQLGCHVVVQHLGSLPVHVQDAQHGFPVVLVAVEGAHPVGQPGRSPVGVSGHQGGDSGGH